ncbi:MAG: right-handed parallel beta-helix repeat-containing protein [Bacteroidetes bacterium]|nr:right-handed parallel beta-helix repeat-containing protein [Bacteroidota bacterium]
MIFKISRKTALIILGIIFPLTYLNAQDKTTTFADFYVAPKGNDKWSGKLSEPNADFTDGPFATINRAKQAVKYFKKDIYRNIFVMIRGGDYCLTEPEVFTADDGHYDSYKVVYMAYPDEEPIFHSDIEVSGWQLAGAVKGLPTVASGYVYVAKIPKLPVGKERFYTLYDNGKLLTRAHSKGFEPTKKMSGGDGGGNDWKGMVNADRTLLWFPKGSLKKWSNLDDIEIFIQPNVGYVTNYLTLSSVDTATGEAHTSIPATYPMGKVDKHLFAFKGGNFRVENVLDYLDTPGEWVVNTKEGLIYYWPIHNKPGKVTFPALTQYFFIDGHEKGDIVRNIAFQGLTFTRGDRELVTQNDAGLQHEWDMWNKGNALIRFRDVAYCEVDGCRFTNSASAGLRFDLYAQSNVVKNNLIDFVGGTGVLFCGYGPGKLDVNKNNRIINNHIHHCGEFYYQANAIMIWQSGENTIKNNKLHDLPYDAIVLSGSRPLYFNINHSNREMESTLRRNEISSVAQFQETITREQIIDHYNKIVPYSLTRNNLVEDNEIFSTMNKMFDGNAIYLSDVGFGNSIHRNYIHHLSGKGMQQAIRTDAFIKNTTISDNIIYNCNCGGINVKLYENNVYNNIVADIHDIVYETSDGISTNMFLGYISLLEVFKRSEMPPHVKLDIKHNIFYKTHIHNPFYRESLVDGEKKQVKLEECEIDQNIYFDINAKDKGLQFLQDYRRRGVDANSIAEDPMFVDVKHGDFRLKKGSPAYKIGFKDIDMTHISLTDDFPVIFNKIVRDQLGEKYDSFEKLEDKCKPMQGATSKEFKEIQGI